MVSARDTLIIKHLPHDLNDNDKEELLKHFGAKEVKCISSKVNKYNVVFARFGNEQVADHVLRRLHQLNVNGTRLSVEFTNEVAFADQEQSLKTLENEEEKEIENCYQNFLEKLNSWHSSLNFKQPVPSHLRYQYPPPDNMVLLNIAKALATVPKFYTQVLHLMNKMNLPCPFGKDILPNFNMQLFSVQNEKENESVQPQNKAPESEEMRTEVDTSESEISSDDDTRKQKETIPYQLKKRKKKVMNLPKFIKPMQTPKGTKKQKKTSIDEMFEKVSEEKETKKIKLSHPPMDLPKASDLEEPQQSSSGFGFIHPVTKPPSPPPPVDVRDEREEERPEKPEIHCITLEELEQNRILEKDWSVLPVFKNYAEGAPTQRLYIKNLAKTVTEEDLRYIYNRYVSKDPFETHVMDIRLMQEGRMKGQAFITFHSVQAAQTALKETNGFILKEKPLVVQFARSAIK